MDFDNQYLDHWPLQRKPYPPDLHDLPRLLPECAQETQVRKSNVANHNGLVTKSMVIITHWPQQRTPCLLDMHPPHLLPEWLPYLWLLLQRNSSCPPLYFLFIWDKQIPHQRFRQAVTADVTALATAEEAMSSRSSFIIYMG